MIHDSRIRHLNRAEKHGGDYILYWMQASQRTRYNHALEYSIREANRQKLPVVVYCGVTDAYPEANLRHYKFMLEGLKVVSESLASMNIKFILRHEHPAQGVVALAKKAAITIFDMGYTMPQRYWRAEAVKNIAGPIIQVESDAVIPVETASFKEEYSAATLRVKILKLRHEFLRPLTHSIPEKSPAKLEITSLNAAEPDQILQMLSVDRTVAASSLYHGGSGDAERLLNLFLNEKLDSFGELRNHPDKNFVSNLSPYLHFGQISPLHIALSALNSGSPGTEPFLEELLVRRELAINFVYFNPAYDQFQCLPEWAKKSLNAHSADQRKYLYRLDELEQGLTHDPYWNAAQHEMLRTGKMHGYMRMYWGKKILEWSATAGEAFRRALYLNNKYELDGRDPSGFAGVAWCFGKHDRPWGERMIFGNVRYMNAAGLEHKFKIADYVKKVNLL